MVYRFIVSELHTWSRNLNTTFILADCPFEAMKLNKNADLEKYWYKGHGIGLDACLQFPLLTDVWVKHIFGVDNSLSVHTEGRNQGILVFVEEPTDGLGDTKMTMEANYSVNISTSRKSILCNAANSF